MEHTQAILIHATSISTEQLIRIFRCLVNAFIHYRCQLDQNVIVESIDYDWIGYRDGGGSIIYSFISEMNADNTTI